MLTSDQITQFERNGFLNGGQVLDDAQVEVLREELKRVIERPETSRRSPVMLHNLTGNEAAPVWQVVNIWQASAPFEKLLHHRQITSDIAQLTGGSTLRIWHDQIQYKPAATGGVNMWHQDAPLWPIIEPMTEVSAWVALDDVDEENGCMSMVPGSHRWGDHMTELWKLPNYDSLPREYSGHEVRVVTCPVRKGEVHYHHALTWHGSHENKSGRPRRAIALHFMTDETRYVASGEHVMKPFVEVQDGELLQGGAFPVVYNSAS